MKRFFWLLLFTVFFEIAADNELEPKKLPTRTGLNPLEKIQASFCVVGSYMVLNVLLMQIPHGVRVMRYMLARPWLAWLVFPHRPYHIPFLDEVRLAPVQAPLVEYNFYAG